MSFTEPRAEPNLTVYMPVSQFGSQLIEHLQPWLTLHLAWLADSIGVMVDPLYGLVMDQGVDGQPGYVPGYGQLLDPALASGGELAYLGQFVGVQVPAGVDDVTARSLVVAEAGLARGTDAAAIAAAKRTLTGTQTVYYFPRRYSDGTAQAGWAGMIVLTAECASLAVTEAAVRAVKLSGVQMWFAEISGWTIGALEGSYATISDVEAAFVTVGGAEGDVPGA